MKFLFVIMSVFIYLNSSSVHADTSEVVNNTNAVIQKAKATWYGNMYNRLWAWEVASDDITYTCDDSDNSDALSCVCRGPKLNNMTPSLSDEYYKYKVFDVDKNVSEQELAKKASEACKPAGVVCC